MAGTVSVAPTGRGEGGGGGKGEEVVTAEQDLLPPPFLSPSDSFSNAHCHSSPVCLQLAGPAWKAAGATRCRFTVGERTAGPEVFSHHSLLLFHILLLSVFSSYLGEMAGVGGTLARRIDNGGRDELNDDGDGSGRDSRRAEEW